ncbi:unnamed protein product, partial [Prorocentrum cordatum]
SSRFGSSLRAHPQPWQPRPRSLPRRWHGPPRRWCAPSRAREPACSSARPPSWLRAASPPRPPRRRRCSARAPRRLARGRPARPPRRPWASASPWGSPRDSPRWRAAARPPGARSPTPRGLEYHGWGKYEWDPLELSTTYPEHLAWYREAELKHCRVAMLAFVGFIAPDGFRIPIPQLEDPELNLYNAHGKLIGPGLGEGPMWWLLAFCGVVESLRFRDLGLGFEKLSLENAGDLNFGKGFLPQTKEGEVQMRIKELKNGRLAMLAVSGILTQSVVWQSPHFPFVPGS